MPRNSTIGTGDDFTFNHLRQLVGKKVVGVCIAKEMDYVFYGLQFEDGTQTLIQKDPEANEPGWLNIFNQPK